LYFNIKNDNETGHTATVATPLKQGASLHRELAQIYNIPENIDSIGREKLVSQLLSKSRAAAKINGVYVFDKISVNGKTLDVDSSFCMYIREETDPINVHFGRQKVHYPPSLVFEDIDVNINNRAVVKAVTEYLVNGTPVEKTVYGCDELIMFQKIVKISDKYSYGMKNCSFTKKGIWNQDGYRLNESTLRVYASSRPSDGGVFKMKNNPEKIADTSDKCFIHNESVVGKKCPSYLDKNFYVTMAKERINKFKGV
jgi:hypothetical protein